MLKYEFVSLQISNFFLNSRNICLKPVPNVIITDATSNIILRFRKQLRISAFIRPMVNGKNTSTHIHAHDSRDEIVCENILYVYTKGYLHAHHLQ